MTYKCCLFLKQRYVKEDLIIPHSYSFYDLIISKARGKSGPLFHFDVHDDVRIGLNDSRIEKDESHPGKIVERRWFEVGFSFCVAVLRSVLRTGRVLRCKLG